MAKKPASQMITETVESFVKRSRMELSSGDVMLLSELRRIGAAYWAEASQMKALRPANSAVRLATYTQRVGGERG